MKIIIIFSLISFLLTGCNSAAEGSSSDASAVSNVEIGVCIDDFNDNYLSVVKIGLEEIDSADDSISITILNAEGDAELQQQQLETLLSQGVDVVAVSIADPETTAMFCALAEAEEKNIVFFGNTPSAEQLADYDNYTNVLADENSAGRLQAELALEHYENGIMLDKNNDGVMQYLLLKGEEGNTISLVRSESVIETLDEADAELLGQISTDWSTDNTVDRLTELQNEIDLSSVEAILCNSDGIALGALEFLSSTENSVAIYGIDAIPQAVDAVKSGSLFGTIYNDPYRMAEVVSDTSVDIARDVPAFEGTRFIDVPLTKVSAE